MLSHLNFGKDNEIMDFRTALIYNKGMIQRGGTAR